MTRIPRAAVWIGAALCTVGALVLLYRPGYERRQHIDAALVAAESEHQHLEARHAELAAHVARLRDDPVELEREARLQLGLVRPGEVIYKFPPAETP